MSLTPTRARAQRPAALGRHPGSGGDEAAVGLRDRCAGEKRSRALVSIPIENETPYTLTDAMRQAILHDAHEHFGDEVHSIRIQEGLERHVFNARTHQVRYAFSPTDFGLM